MTATVLSKRQDSLGTGQPLTSTFVMDQDYRRQDQSRSPRLGNRSTNSIAETAQKERISSNMEEPQQQQQQNHHHHQPSPSPSTNHAEDSQMQDWRYPRQQQQSSLKRRNSQISGSRPWPQQGFSQLDNVKEVEMDQQVGEDVEKMESQDSEIRKARRLSHQHHRKNVSSGSARGVGGMATGQNSTAAGGDWPFKRPTSRMSDSEPTSASSRLLISHSRTSSDEVHGSRLAAGSESSDRLRGKNLQQLDEEQGSNYTWRLEEERRREEGESERKSDGSPSTSAAKLPAFRSMAAPSGPSAAASHTRNSSPSPRLPGFASIQSHPSSSHYPQHSQQQQQLAGDERGYNMPRYPSPRPGAHSVASIQSPSLSQTSQAPQLTPSQAFIHPALAGLPGAGGVAGSKQQPSFVSKLYSMLEDETIEDMISWGPSGTVFSVANPAEFSKIVLPNWFKHSNWQSFVRQLNMYGFHKVNHTYQGTPEEEIQVWEFKHPSFRRGEIQLLNDIKRKSSRHKRQGSLGQSMSNAIDYEAISGRSPGSTTPSPEMTISHLGPPSSRGMIPASGPPHHRHHSTRSLGGGIPSYARYSELSQAMPPGVAGPSSRHHHGVSSSSSIIYGIPPPGESIRVVEDQDGGMIASESSARMDDLSDRIDAIIRHASYLESQLQSVSDQLYQSQQNEVSLGIHIQHLETQLRGIEDHLQLRPGPPLVKRPSSPSSPSGNSATSGVAAPFLNREPSRGSTGHPAQSPIATHPSYSSSYNRGPSTYSSADAYQVLPPPRASSIRREEMLIRSPIEAGEKRYRN